MRRVFPRVASMDLVGAVFLQLIVDVQGNSKKSW